MEAMLSQGYLPEISIRSTNWGSSHCSSHSKIEVTFRAFKEKMWGHGHRFFMKRRDKSDIVKLGKLAQDLTARDEGFKKTLHEKAANV